MLSHHISHIYTEKQSLRTAFHSLSKKSPLRGLFGLNIQGEKSIKLVVSFSLPTAPQFLRADRHELYINRVWLQTPEISRFGGSRVFSLFCNHEVCGYGVQKKGIISKNGSLQDLNSAVPILNGRKCNDFAHLLPFFVFYLSNDCKNSRGN